MIRIKIQGAKVSVKRITKTTDRVKRATMFGINKAVDKTRTAVKREAAKDYLVLKRDVQNALVVKKSNMTSLKGSVMATGKPIELKKFKVSPMKIQNKGRRNKRLHVRVKRDSGGKELGSAFVALLSKQNDLNVYERTGRERHIVNKLFGPSIPQMIKNKSVVTRISKDAETKLKEEVNRQIVRLLGGSK